MYPKKSKTNPIALQADILRVFFLLLFVYLFVGMTASQARLGLHGSGKEREGCQCVEKKEEKNPRSRESKRGNPAQILLEDSCC